MSKRIITIENKDIPFLRDAIRMYSMRGYQVFSHTISKGPYKCRVMIDCSDYIFEKIKEEFNASLWISG